MPSRVNLYLAKEYADVFRSESHCVVVGYQGLTAREAVGLRSDLRQKDLRLRVVKNSLAARVFEEGGFRGLSALLSGPCAILTGAEMSVACRAITEWIGKNKKMEVRGGFAEGRVLKADDIRRMANIPPKPVLLAQFLGEVQGVSRRVAGAFQSVTSALARALQEICRQREAAAGAAEEKA